MKATLLDLITEGHELFIPPLAYAVEDNPKIAEIVQQAIKAENVLPELLKALEYVYECLPQDDDYVGKHILAVVHIAIAKTKGGKE